MSSIVQLNVRMDRDLRDAGNDALRSAGLLPSELVRSIWMLAARRGESLKSIVDLVRGQAAEEESALRVDDPLSKGQLLYDEALRDLGIRRAVATEALQERSFSSMTEEALLGKWTERGLVDG